MPRPLYFQRPFLAQWGLLGVILLVLLGVVSVDAYQRRIRTEKLEQERLLAATKIVGINLEQSLRAVNEVLATLQKQALTTRFDEPLNLRLRVLADAMPSVRTLNFFDVTATIRATSRAELLGTNKNYAERDYFRQPMLHPSIETLYISQPFRLVTTGLYSLTATRMLAGPSGEFAGVVVATLDPTYFSPLINSVRYENDVTSALTHGDGVVFLMEPTERNASLGKNIAQPESLFLRHRASDAPATVLSGTVKATGEDRMLAQRTVRPIDLKVDKSIEVAVSRLNSGIYAVWWHDVERSAAYYCTVSLLLVVALIAYQRRAARLMASEHEAREALTASERFMHTVIDNIPGMIAYWSADLRNAVANASYLEWFGKTPEQMRGMTMQALLGEALFAKNEPYIRAVLRGERQDFERTLTKADGSIGYTWAHYIPDYDDGKVRGFFVLVSDITPLKQAELALQVSEQFARTTIDAVPEHICVLDKHGAIVTVNQAWRDFYEANCPDVAAANYGVGSNYLNVFTRACGAHATVATGMEQGILSVIRGEQHQFELEYSCDSPTERRVFKAQVVRFHGDSGNVLISHENITERKKAEELMEHMAHTDALTGLSNRRYFMELAEQELARTVRYGGELSVLMMDIDHFKQVNDTYGHPTGDLVIKVIGTVCQATLRGIDAMGRIGGEEFAIVLPQTGQEQAFEVAERLRLAFAQTLVPLERGMPLRFTVSIGIAVLTNADCNLDMLLGFADKALYEAKNGGRNRTCIHSGH